MTDTERRDWKEEWDNWPDPPSGEEDGNDQYNSVVSVAWVDKLLAHCEGLELDNEKYRKRIIEVVEQRDRFENIIEERDTYKEQLEQAQHKLDRLLEEYLKIDEEEAERVKNLEKELEAHRMMIDELDKGLRVIGMERAQEVFDSYRAKHLKESE